MLLTPFQRVLLPSPNFDIITHGFIKNQKKRHARSCVACKFDIYPSIYYLIWPIRYCPSFLSSFVSRCAMLLTPFQEIFSLLSLTQSYLLTFSLPFRILSGLSDFFSRCYQFLGPDRREMAWMSVVYPSIRWVRSISIWDSKSKLYKGKVVVLYSDFNIAWLPILVPNSNLLLASTLLARLLVSQQVLVFFFLRFFFSLCWFQSYTVRLLDLR